MPVLISSGESAPTYVGALSPLLGLKHQGPVSPTYLHIIMKLIRDSQVFSGNLAVRRLADPLVTLRWPLITKLMLASRAGLVVFFAVSCLLHQLLPSPARLAPNPGLLF